MEFRVVTAAEKAEAIRLVVELNYFVPNACQQTGVGLTALRRWVSKRRKGAGRSLSNYASSRPGTDRFAVGQIEMLGAESRVRKKRLYHLKAHL